MFEKDAEKIAGANKTDQVNHLHHKSYCLDPATQAGMFSQNVQKICGCDIHEALLNPVSVAFG